MSNLNKQESRVETTKSEPTSMFGIKEPIKLVVQMLYLFVICIPFTLWAMVSDLFARKKRINGNVVVVTGAGRGLGRGLALKFAELGCKVACADVDETNNAETVALIRKTYPNTTAIAYRCNVAVLDDIKSLSKNIANDMGDVDIIVNNAGLVSEAKITNMKKSYLDLVVDVNLKSHFLMIKEFLPRMMERNSGHIVAIASLSGLGGLPNASLYSATKHGLIGLMETLYDELRAIPGNQIQTTCICPYFIKTNELYSKTWDLRLPELSVEQVTDATSEAILKNKRIVVIPSFMYPFAILIRYPKRIVVIPSFMYPFAILIRLLPDNLRNLIRDIFYTRVTLVEHGPPGNNIEAIMADTVNRVTTDTADTGAETKT